MQIDELTSSLRNLKGPDRELDVAVAIYWGFQNLSADNDGNAEWKSPDGKIGQLPRFTELTTAALNLVELALPGADWGIGGEEGKGSACINGGDYFEAANPAIALCIASLHAKR